MPFTKSINTLRHIKHSIFGMPEKKKPVVQDSDFFLPVLSYESLIEHSSTAALKILSSQVHRPRDMVLPLIDLLTIATVCRTRNPDRILEIGTYTGETTLTMAANTGEQCNIFTLDLPLGHPLKKEMGNYQTGWHFADAQEASKITQLYGLSQTFDFSPYYQSFDLIFIDGDHSREIVKSDTENALKCLRPGGIIVWDDYRYLPCHVVCKGVADYLHSMADSLPVFQLEGTRLAVMMNDSK
jgi:hypothetical protein